MLTEHSKSQNLWKCPKYTRHGFASQFAFDTLGPHQQPAVTSSLLPSQTTFPSTNSRSISAHSPRAGRQESVFLPRTGEYSHRSPPGVRSATLISHWLHTTAGAPSRRRQSKRKAGYPGQRERSAGLISHGDSGVWGPRALAVCSGRARASPKECA